MYEEFAEEHRMVIDLVEKFVENELMPFEKVIMEREASGQKPPYCRRKRNHYSPNVKSWGCGRLMHRGRWEVPNCRRR